MEKAATIFFVSNINRAGANVCVRFLCAILLRDEFLYAHAVVDVTNVNGAIFANSEIVAPIYLAIVIAEAAPLRENLSREIEFEKLAAIGRRRLEVAAVNDVEEIVGADGKGPR